MRAELGCPIKASIHPTFLKPRESVKVAVIRGQTIPNLLIRVEVPS
jgi:hypothetical protein